MSEKGTKITTCGMYADSILASDWRGSRSGYDYKHHHLFFFPLIKETVIFSDPANEQFIRVIHALLLKSFSIKVFRFFVLERIYHVER